MESPSILNETKTCEKSSTIATKCVLTMEFRLAVLPQRDDGMAEMLQWLFLCAAYRSDFCMTRALKSLRYQNNLM